MRKNHFFAVVLAISFLTLNNCGVKDVIDETIDAASCATLMTKISNDDDYDSCSELVSDIDKILSTCKDFITEEQIDDLNFLKDNCTDD